THRFYFKGRNLFADRGLTDSQFPGNGGEAPFFHHPDEHPQRVELIHSGLPIPRAIESTRAAVPPSVIAARAIRIPGGNRCYSSVRPILPQACHIGIGVVNGPSKAKGSFTENEK